MSTTSPHDPANAFREKYGYELSRIEHAVNIANQLTPEWPPLNSDVYASQARKHGWDEEDLNEHIRALQQELANQVSSGNLRRRLRRLKRQGRGQ